MEHDSSFNKRLRKEITTRAEMNKKTKLLEVDIDEKNRKIYDVDEEINTIKKAISKRRHKDRKNREILSRLNELKKLKTDFRNEIDALNQITSHIEELKDEPKIEIKRLKKKN